MIRRTLVIVTCLLAVALPAKADDFSESEGCGVAGVRPPLGEHGGRLPTSQIVYGPWGDAFGRTYAEVSAQMHTWEIPMSGGRTVRVHADALPAYQQVTANLAAAQAEGLYYNVFANSGWSWRAVVGNTTRMSFHAFGTATDINPGTNPYLNDPDAVLVTDMPEWYRQAWESAGFCWGGAWLSKKDAMHFSWMGPSSTPNYGPTPPPEPPLTTRAGFDRVGFSGKVGLAPSFEWELALADRNRDGAPDIYGFRWLADGALRMELLGAGAGFGVPGTRLNLRLPGISSATHSVALFDFDGDGWVDIWARELATGKVTVFADSAPHPHARPVAGRFTTIAGSFEVPLSATLLGGHANRDRVVDLFLIDAKGHLVVRDGATRFATVLAEAETGVDPAAGQVRLGDGDEIPDGLSDLYWFGPEGLRIHTAADGYRAGASFPTLRAQPGVRYLVDDYDGDGRHDIYRVGEELGIEVWLGGARGSGENLQEWFIHELVPPWDAGPECLGAHPCDQLGYVSTSAQFNLKADLDWTGEDHEFYFGNPGDIPLMGDWDGDGDATPAMYRPSRGWAYLTNTSATTLAERDFFFGNPADLPIAGDWDGDGRDSLGIYRPAEGKVYLSNRLDTGFADVSYSFGLPGDQPLVGDFDGDGKDSVGLYRPSTSFVYFRNSTTSGPAESSFYFGNPGDVIVAGDWDGDGIDTVASFRSSLGRWYLALSNRQGVADHSFNFGPDSRPVRPVVGRFGSLAYGER